MWIDFEGIDGSGKTTLSIRAAHWLRGLGLAVTHARENGTFRSRVTARIRELTRDTESVLLAPRAELLLNAAREAQVLSEEVRPALARGEIVITDRALHSHMALAGFVRRLPHADVRAVADAAAAGLWPDLVVFVLVDPDVARMRKRLRKIRERRLGSAGRKGASGQALSKLFHHAFLTQAQADPVRWRLLDNSHRSLEEADAEVRSLLSSFMGLPALPSRPAPAPPRVASGRTLAEWSDHFFEFAAELSRRDPAAAAIHVAGIDDPRADAIRAGAAREHPDVAAWTISGMATPAAWALRRELASRAPYHVARGLAGLTGPDAWELRRRLEAEAPEQVLHSLEGIAEDRAYELRGRLWDRAPEEGLRSLAGLSDGRSWELRSRAERGETGGALAESLAGIEQDPSWSLRRRLRAHFPFSVLRSLKRLRSEEAWKIRAEMAETAPGAVLETMNGFEGPDAERLRDALQGACPDEVAASLYGLDTPEAWRRREGLLEIAPEGVLSGLYGLPCQPLALGTAELAMARSEGRPRLARKAAVLHLRSAAPAARSA